MAICKKQQVEPSELAKKCKNLISRLVDSEGDRALAMNESAVKLETQKIAFSARNQDHLLAALEAQSERGEYLFLLAVLVVILGVCASALQFVKVWKEEVVSDMEISVSEKQLNVKTSWIGVVLLAMSMGFFMLYLVFVYKIAPL